MPIKTLSDPTTPTRRASRPVVSREDITKERPEKSLVEIQDSAPAAATAPAASPRASSAAAHKQAYRVVDFKRDKAGIPAVVAAIEYDPNRSARIALLHYADGEKRYILQPDGLKVGQKVMSGPAGRHPAGQRAAAEEHAGRHDRAQHRTAARQGRADGALGRLAGATGFQGRRHGAAEAAFGRNAARALDCMATVGQVGNVDHENVSLGKAGRTRWLGKMPHNRGVTMNPVDHPHGGGEGKTSGGRHPVTPWGQPTRGFKTRNNKRTDKWIVDAEEQEEVSKWADPSRRDRLPTRTWKPSWPC